VQYADVATQQIKFASLRIANDVAEYFEKISLPRFYRRALAQRRVLFGGRAVYLSRADLQLVSSVNATLWEEQWAVLTPSLDYLQHPGAIEAVRVALALAVAAHDGQKRKSGEWYITHPVAVAMMVAEHRMELDLIIAALLHDIVEDTRVTIETVRRIFGHTVASLVAGVTKIRETGEFDDLPSEEKSMINLQKMLLAMASDYRVVLLKLFDRLHNMRTLGHMKPAKQRAIADETHRIFVPVADRVGLVAVRVELEHLCFKYLFPEQYARLAREAQSYESAMNQATSLLQDQLSHDPRLQEVGIRVFTAPTDMAAVWHQGAAGAAGAHLGLRVVLAVKAKQSEDLTPYFVRGEALVHDILQSAVPLPVEVTEQLIHPGRHPGVQSAPLYEQQPLNILVFTTWMQGPSGTVPSGAVPPLHASTYEVPWLTQIRDWVEEFPSARQFVEVVEKEVLGPRVTVAVADGGGSVLDLAAGATALDAAVHYSFEVAVHLESVLVDGQPVSLDHPLRNGQLVAFRVGGLLRVAPEWAAAVHTYEAARRLQYFLLSHPTRQRRPRRVPAP
jgi:hypothetical protein